MQRGVIVIWLLLCFRDSAEWEMEKFLELFYFSIALKLAIAMVSGYRVHNVCLADRF
jgi:hypothetical protein